MDYRSEKVFNPETTTTSKMGKDHELLQAVKDQDFNTLQKILNKNKVSKSSKLIAIFAAE